MAVSIKDVAIQAGVSTATVSKVMNHSPSISEETCNRVKAVMEQLDYHPNRRARNFAKQSTRSIMFITRMEKDCAFENPHMFEIMSGLQSVLSAKNYMLNIINVSNEDCLQQIEQMVYEKCADGIVIHAGVLSRQLERFIRTQDLPHLMIGCPEFATQLCWIDNNNVQAGETAIKYLLNAGYTDIAFVGGIEEDKISEHRLSGVAGYLQLVGRRLPKNRILRGASTIESGEIMATALLKEKNRPQVVLCANNHLAYGCMKAIKARGLNIPDEIGVMAFDDYPFARFTEPKLTIVDIDVYDLGCQAAKLILKKIRQPNLQIQSYTTLTSLKERESTLPNKV